MVPVVVLSRHWFGRHLLLSLLLLFYVAPIVAKDALFSTESWWHKLFPRKTSQMNNGGTTLLCSSLDRLDVWDAASKTVLFPNLRTGAVLCPSSEPQQTNTPTRWTIEAVASSPTSSSSSSCVSSVLFELRGRANGYRYTHTERSRKYLLFGGDTLATGRDLPVGDYTLVVTLNNNGNPPQQQRTTVAFSVAPTSQCNNSSSKPTSSPLHPPPLPLPPVVPPVTSPPPPMVSPIASPPPMVSPIASPRPPPPVVSPLASTPPPPLPRERGPLLAFPTAQGYGALSQGGRGGRVMKVTTLADGEDTLVGSLRHALLTPEPRIIFFGVAGTITLTRRIIIKGPQYSYLTIAGQSAPGDGVQIKGYELNFSDLSHVVIRYMRFRPGFTRPEDHAKFSLMFSGAGDQATHHIVVDHCTFSWATDDTGMWGNVHHVSWQHSIMGEAMFHDFNVSGNKPISRGMIIGAEDGQGAKQYNISVHNNYYVNNDQRNAYWSGVGPYEFINNLVYNWGSFGTSMRARSGSFKINMIGNRYREGPALKVNGRYAIGIDEEFPNEQIYLQGNLDTRYRTNSSQPEWDIVGTGNVPPEQLNTNYWRVNAPTRHQRQSPWPNPIVPVVVKPSSAVVESVQCVTRTMPNS
jgi:pectate lyase